MSGTSETVHTIQQADIRDARGSMVATVAVNTANPAVVPDEVAVGINYVRHMLQGGQRVWGMLRMQQNPDGMEPAFTSRVELTFDLTNRDVVIPIYLVVTLAAPCRTPVARTFAEAIKHTLQEQMPTDETPVPLQQFNPTRSFWAHWLSGGNAS